MDVIQAQNQLENIFLQLGFVYKIINEKKYLVFKIL